MAALTIGDIEVKSSDANVEVVQFGAAAAAGAAVYLSSSDGKYYPADADVDEDTAAARAIVITKVTGADDYGVIVSSGDIDLGDTLTVGVAYMVSSTAGAIEPEADLSSNDWITPLGRAIAADNLRLGITPSGVQKP